MEYSGIVDLLFMVNPFASQTNEPSRRSGARAGEVPPALFPDAEMKLDKSTGIMSIESYYTARWQIVQWFPQGERI
jgi:hypothetical protein